MRILPSDPTKSPKIKSIIQKTYNIRQTDWGISKFCSIKHATDPEYGYCDEQGYLSIVVEFTS